jgi:hypothetical protein
LKIVKREKLMIHHEHYLGWTIEWEDKSYWDKDFHICTQYVDIETDSIKTARYSIEAGSLYACKTLIRDIISDQINSARKVIASYHYELLDGIPKPTCDDSDDDDLEGETVAIYPA